MTKLYKRQKPPGHTGSPVQKKVKSGLHFNILSSFGVNEVNGARAQKTSEYYNHSAID
jgi:hypothetical protein